MRAKKQSYFRRRLPIGKVEFYSNNPRGLGGQFAFKGDARSVALAKVFRLHLVARAVGIWCCLPLGGGCRRHWQDDLGGDLPGLTDFYPIYDHQEWLGRSVLPRVGDRDVHGDVGLRNILR